MGERITDAWIKQAVINMQRDGMDVGLDGQYGRWRVTNKSGDRNLSARVPNREIAEWLWAYKQGWNAGHQIALDGVQRAGDPRYWKDSTNVLENDGAGSEAAGVHQAGDSTTGGEDSGSGNRRGPEEE